METTHRPCPTSPSPGRRGPPMSSGHSGSSRCQPPSSAGQPPAGGRTEMEGNNNIRNLYCTVPIIQILPGTVMKYHVSVDCQESYIFPRDYTFPKCVALRENITILAPPTYDISSVPVDIRYIRWSKWIINQNCMVFYDYHEVWYQD